MSSYRVYSVDPAGKIIGLQSLDAETDDDAVTLARALTNGTTCEVWKRAELVQTITGADAEGAKVDCMINPAKSPEADGIAAIHQRCRGFHG